MSIVEQGKLGQPELSALLGMQRECRERVNLPLEGRALFVDGLFVLCFREAEAQNDGESFRELAITRDVTLPISLVRKDGTLRTYGFIPSRTSGRVFGTVGLGFRPARPIIFINNGQYKITFESDSNKSLDFTLESRETVTKRYIFGHIDHEEFMRDLDEQGRLSLEAEKELAKDDNIATAEDIESHKRYQIARYLKLLGAGNLTRQWEEWGRKHMHEIAGFK